MSRFLAQIYALLRGVNGRDQSLDRGLPGCLA